MQTTYPQQETFRKRLPVVIVGLVFGSLILLLRLLSFQFPLDPRTTTYLDDLRDSGYTRNARAFALAETIATAGAAQTSPAALVAILMASPPHRALLLSPTYRDVGIGVVSGSPVGSGTGATLTLDLGRRVLR